MAADVGRGGDVRGEQDPRIAPQARVGGVVELAEVDVERGATELPRRKRGDQRLLVHDLAARDVDEHRSVLHRRERIAADQVLGLRRPLAADRDEVALREQVVQPARAPDLAEAVTRRSGTPPRADDPHAERRAEPADLAPDAARPDHADRLAGELDGRVVRRPEPPLGALGLRDVKPLREVQDAGDRVLRDRQVVGAAARRGDHHAGIPEVAPPQVRRSRRALVHPLELRRPRPDVEREGEADDDDLRLREERVPRLPSPAAARTRAEVALRREGRPRLPDLPVEPPRRHGEGGRRIDGADLPLDGLRQRDEGEDGEAHVRLFLVVQPKLLTITGAAVERADRPPARRRSD